MSFFERATPPGVSETARSRAYSGATAQGQGRGRRRLGGAPASAFVRPWRGWRGNASSVNKSAWILLHDRGDSPTVQGIAPKWSGMMLERVQRNKVLIVLHQDHSTPGRIGTLLAQCGFTLDVR